jgi:DNA-binding transcriptional LysR family regulator
LEKHFDVTLIDRSIRPWRLTLEGDKLFQGAGKIIAQINALEAEIKGILPPENTQIRIACIYSVGIRHMRQQIEKFQQQYPQTRIKLMYEHPGRILESLSHNKIDMGIISFPKANKILSVIPLFKEPMVIACSPDHRCAGLKMVLIHQFQNEPFISFSKELPIRREVDSFLKSNQVQIKTVLEFDNVESIKRAVEAGSGISILPRPSLDREVETGTLSAVDFSPESFYRPLGIIHLRAKHFNRESSRFIEYLEHATPF